MSKRLTGLNSLVKWEIKGSIPFYSTKKIKNMNNKLRNIVKSYKDSNMNPKLLTGKLTKHYNLTNGERHELLWILLNKNIKTI